MTKLEQLVVDAMAGGETLSWGEMIGIRLGVKYRARMRVIERLLAKGVIETVSNGRGMLPGFRLVDKDAPIT